jgi:hypothetical protein
MKNAHAQGGPRVQSGLQTQLLRSNESQRSGDFLHCRVNTQVIVIYQFTPEGKRILHQGRHGRIRGVW